MADRPRRLLPRECALPRRLVVAVGHSQYRAMQVADLRPLCRGERPVLADVKALYDRHAAMALGFEVFRL